MSNNVMQEIPITAFGEVAVAESTPVVQIVAQYGQTSNTDQINLGGGSSQVSKGLFSASSNTSAQALGSLLSKRAVSYKAGQGVRALFTAMFDTPQTGNEQDAGLLAFSDTLTIGYKDLDFGIWHRSHAEPEVQVLTLTAASAPETASVTVDGTLYSIPLTTTVAAQHAYEIAVYLNANVPLWDFDPAGNTVIAVQNLVTETVGSFAFSSATATGVWSQSQAAYEWSEANGNIQFIKQADWNGNYSFTIDPTKLHPYKIAFEFLGGGGIDFYAENPTTSDFELIHRIEYAGKYTRPSLRNPSFRVGIASENKGNTTDVTVQTASMAGFIEGKKQNTTPSRATNYTQTGIGTTPTNIVTLRVRNEFGLLRNLAEAELALSGFSSDSTKPVEVRLIKNGTPATPLSFTNYNQNGSIMQIATNAVAITGGDVIAAGTIGSINFERLNQILVSGETLSIVMNITSGAASTMSASVIWLEDQ